MCDKRFTTYERIEIKMPQVVKKNGNRVPSSDHDKLRGQLKLALRKRPVTIEAIDAAVDRIEGSCCRRRARSQFARRSANWSCAS
jgi:transcriptional repressor NrdR